LAPPKLVKHNAQADSQPIMINLLKSVLNVMPHVRLV
jgi:hypothetical protein